MYKHLKAEGSVWLQRAKRIGEPPGMVLCFLLGFSPNGCFPVKLWNGPLEALGTEASFRKNGWHWWMRTKRHPWNLADLKPPSVSVEAGRRFDLGLWRKSKRMRQIPLQVYHSPKSLRNLKATNLKVELVVSYK